LADKNSIPFHTAVLIRNTSALKKDPKKWVFCTIEERPSSLDRFNRDEVFPIKTAALRSGFFVL
jgi:hypothetical protein